MIFILVPVVVGFILGRWRDSSGKIFDKKLEVYSEIVYEINAHRYSYVEIKHDKNKLENITSHKNDEKLIDLENINLQEEKLTYKDSLIKLFAPARLLGSMGVINESREYFSLIGEYFNPDSKNLNRDINNEISISAMKLEQLMRKDLLGFWSRHLSDNEIEQHIKNKRNPKELS